MKLRTILVAFRYLILVAVMVVLIGFLIPQRFVMPVQGASKADYNPESFWFHPWGLSGTHKGVDIFAPANTDLKSSTSGLVVYTGTIGRGGNIVLVLGPKWRFHYYAHLNEINTKRFSWVRHGDLIGKVGDSGNATGKPPHLHYSIYTMLPYPWRMDDSPQGWRKMFYLDPTPLLNAAAS